MHRLNDGWRVNRDARQIRRLLALTLISEGGSRTQAAQTGAVGLQTVRDWVLAFNVAGPDDLIERKRPGPRSKLYAAQRQALTLAIEGGPDPKRHGVVKWRLMDVAAWLFERFGVSLDESSVRREVKRLGFSRLSAHPRHHEQDPEALSAFKKTSPPA